MPVLKVPLSHGELSLACLPWIDGSQSETVLSLPLLQPSLGTLGNVGRYVWLSLLGRVGSCY